MAKIPDIQHLTMTNVRAEFAGGFARQNQYQVFIENGWGKSKEGRTPFLIHLSTLFRNYKVTWDTTFQRRLAFSCSEASLPASTYATAEVKDNFMGITEEFAHTRINTDIDFTFYVDRDYSILGFFEAWMDFIGGGSETSMYNTINGYYRRFNYPKDYKNSTGFYITKFEKNYIANDAEKITYQLINSFPKSMTSIQLSYGEAEIMKVTVTMNYERYRVFRGEEAPTNDNPGTDASDSTESGGFQFVTNPVNGQPVKRPFQGLLTDKEWNDAYKEGLGQSR